MDAGVLIGWAGLGLSVIIHVIFVSVTLGAGLLAAYIRRLSLRDPAWEAPARRAFKFLSRGAVQACGGPSSRCS